MKNPRVQIREEVKAIPRCHWTEIIGKSGATVSRWIRKGQFPSPTGKKNRFTRLDIERAFESLGQSGIVRFHKRRRYWNEITSSRFILEENGVFLISPSASSNHQTGIRDLIGKVGIWNSQGLNNHIHLNNLEENPILQIELARELIDIWVKKSLFITEEGTFVIYWNGLIDSTVCIYFMKQFDEAYLKNYDTQLGITDCIVSNIL